MPNEMLGEDVPILGLQYNGLRWRNGEHATDDEMTGPSPLPNHHRHWQSIPAAQSAQASIVFYQFFEIDSAGRRNPEALLVFPRH